MLNVGQKVKATGKNMDVPKGTPGEVIEMTHDSIVPYRIRYTIIKEHFAYDGEIEAVEEGTD
ncbi:MAG: hypothetical protein K0S04_302 [Herbinix sp.]|jgi:hypothetical protein|nr:hypothetical protein [Herbinix sp.]